MDAGDLWSVKGRTGDPHDRTIIERIMLRYRPIAPKPVAGGGSSCSGGSGNSSEIVNTPRKKRKYVRVKQTRRCKVGKDGESKKDNRNENFESSEAPKGLGSSRGSYGGGLSITLDFSGGRREEWVGLCESEENNNGVFGGGGAADREDRRAAAAAVESWVMVDGITDTWLDTQGLGCTDMEKVKNLEMDDCPGMISDGGGRVQWVNLAYRRMVDPSGGDGSGVEAAVRLVVKEEVPDYMSAFACTVRVVYTWRNNNHNNNHNNNERIEKHSQTMPCDVWRMDFGGFAWRLDANTALSLGR